MTEEEKKKMLEKRIAQMREKLKADGKTDEEIEKAVRYSINTFSIVFHHIAFNNITSYQHSLRCIDIHLIISYHIVT